LELGMKLTELGMQVSREIREGTEKRGVRGK
jgi:hypothetical protein